MRLGLRSHLDSNLRLSLRHTRYPFKLGRILPVGPRSASEIVDEPVLQCSSLRIECCNPKGDAVAHEDRFLAAVDKHIPGLLRFGCAISERILRLLDVEPELVMHFRFTPPVVLD